MGEFAPGPVSNSSRIVLVESRPAELVVLFARSRALGDLIPLEAELVGRVDEVTEGLVVLVGLAALVRELTKGRLARSVVVLLVPRTEVLLVLSVVTSGRIALDEINEVVVDVRVGFLFSASSLEALLAGFRAEAVTGLVGGLLIVDPAVRADKALVRLEAVELVGAGRMEADSRVDAVEGVAGLIESSLLPVAVEGGFRLSIAFNARCPRS